MTAVQEELALHFTEEETWVYKGGTSQDYFSRNMIHRLEQKVKGMFEELLDDTEFPIMTAFPCIGNMHNTVLGKYQGVPVELRYAVYLRIGKVESLTDHATGHIEIESSSVGIDYSELEKDIRTYFPEPESPE